MGKEGLKFKELRVWQKGKELAVYIYQIKWDTLYFVSRKKHKEIDTIFVYNRSQYDIIGDMK